MNRTRIPTFLALAATASLTLAGCSGGGGDDVELGPLDTYMDQIYATGEDESVADLVEHESERQQLIADCMTEQGFEYIPVEATPEQFGGEMTEEEEAQAEEEAENWDPLDDAKKYGYWISLMPDEDDESFSGGSVEMPADPNDDYLMSLSESDMTAYQEALSGPMPADDADEEEWQNWAPSGCEGDANTAVGQGAESDPYMDPEFADLMDAMNARYDEIESSPELAEANAAWATCMDGKGFGGFANPDEPQEELNEEYSALMGWDDMDAESEPEPLDAAVEQEFQQREIETAVADYECRADVDHDEAWMRADLASQEKFVEAHRTELDAMVAKFASSGKGA
ncbi:hypothetical protein GCM10009847_15420 [Leucobacter tardus]|uniref:Uncharacterized protein n=1 Tax=Leucobacter tardus TaxID=501483 RepID=A0A939QL62_9MICO|nr:hypothetical protein [Leucobacter tardus]MBO2989724.1 hypothetical protein [Leucobacter tardus]